ncbi:MAG: RusA family crossover junction endodeoxyribonuclease [Bacteroidaceae bacterium]|nr:RusA family crossover junction endodeoxyribonuclease [Bacteroidaceae bacterium]
MVIPSRQYRQYEKECGWFVQGKGLKIKDPVNVKCVYYMPTRRRVDLTNLMEATHDILVKYEVLEDDNSKIIRSVDGSRVLYDKENPRTEITIDKAE